MKAKNLILLNPPKSSQREPDDVDRLADLILEAVPILLQGILAITAQQIMAAHANRVPVIDIEVEVLS